MAFAVAGGREKEMEEGRERKRREEGKELEGGRERKEMR